MFRFPNPHALAIKRTGETPEVRSDKRKPRQDKTDRIIDIIDNMDLIVYES